MKPDPETLLSRAEGTITPSVFIDDESGLFSTKYLSEASVYELLRDDEQIHYLFISKSSGVKIDMDKTTKPKSVMPDPGFNGVTAVTDQRILIAIGQEGDDRVINLNPVHLTDATKERNPLSTNVIFETTNNSVGGGCNSPRTKTYTLGVKRRESSDVTKAVEYVQQHLVPAQFAAPENEPTGTELRANGGLTQSEQATKTPDFTDRECAGDAEVHNVSDTDGTGGAESESGSTTEIMEYSNREDILGDIERVADQLEKRPKLSEYASQGSYSQNDVYRHFDSWSNAIDASAVDTASREELLGEIERLESKLGFPPQTSHINEYGEYTAYPYKQEFGSVDEALEKAGYDIEAHVKGTLAEAAAESDGNLTMEDFADKSPYSSNTIYKFWGSWDDALDAIEPEEDSEDDSSVESIGVVQNELSELYEQLRNLQALCRAIVAAQEDEFTDDDSSEPMKAWLERIKNYPEGGSTDVETYGVQQNDRNPLSMNEYREKFGTGDRVTEFNETEARPPIAAVQTLLDPIVDGNPAEFYLPVDPQNGSRFPVFVESQSELNRAIQMLERLPERPASAGESDNPPGDETGTPSSIGGTGTTSRSGSGSRSQASGGIDNLTEVNGVTEEIAVALIDEGYTTQDDLKEASMEELAAVGEIGQIAMRIKLDVSD